MSNRLWRVFAVGIIALTFSSGKIDESLTIEDPLSTTDSMAQLNWVDSVFNSLTFDERLGQLFMVAAY